MRRILIFLLFIYITQNQSINLSYIDNVTSKINLFSATTFIIIPEPIFDLCEKNEFTKYLFGDKASKYVFYIYGLNFFLNILTSKHSYEKIIYSLATARTIQGYHSHKIKMLSNEINELRTNETRTFFRELLRNISLEQINGYAQEKQFKPFHGQAFRLNS